MDLAAAREGLDVQLETLQAEGQKVARRAHHVVRSPALSARLLKWATGTVLAVVGAALLYISTALLYIIVYYRYLPQLVTTVPVHLQYGAGPNPFGIAALDHLHAHQPYDISVSITLPRSPTNLARGNFMVALHLLSPDPAVSAAASSSPDRNLPYLAPVRAAPSLENLLHIPDSNNDDNHHRLQPTRLNLPAYLAAQRIQHTVTRPAILPYADPLAALATRLLLLPYRILFPARSTAARLTVPLAESLAFGSARSKAPGAALPRSLLLEVQAGQEIQVYAADVMFVARLRGLRWLVYRWRLAAFVVVTGGVWIGEVLLLGVVLLMLRGYMRSVSGEGRAHGKVGDGGGGGGGGGGGEDREDGWESSDSDGDGGGGEGGKEATMGSTAAARKGKGVKKEVAEEMEGDERKIKPLFNIPQYDVGLAGEADDEAESPQESRQEKGKERARGKGKGVAREEEAEAEDLGIGTSYSGPASKEGARKRNVG